MALAIGLVAGAVAAATGFFVFDRFGYREPSFDATGSVQSGSVSSSGTVDARATPPPRPTSNPSVPTTPVYGVRAPRTAPRGDTAPSSSTIYRCRVNGVTTYSNVACAGASVVDESGAVTGYDTRPSAALARLVAEGRSADIDRTTLSPTVTRTTRESSVCATMRRQIVDIDADALRPQSAAWQDELRRRRRDILAGMARASC